MLRFSLTYFLWTVLLFVTEVLIALFAHDNFVRPYLGDYLVVILLYCAVRAVLRARPLPVTIAVLLFSYFIELLQYGRILHVLGWEHNRLARTVIGYGAEWSDILAYTLGAVTILLLEKSARSLRGKQPA
ncbi:MAG: DUF2809 domain-containing protein [Chitinophagaceae bacterium]|nr:MAG: DUF2809 domain-containing protein [Chitinophagaceae bacterium]